MSWWRWNPLLARFLLSVLFYALCHHSAAGGCLTSHFYRKTAMRQTCLTWGQSQNFCVVICWLLSTTMTGKPIAPSQLSKQRIQYCLRTMEIAACPITNLWTQYEIAHFLGTDSLLLRQLLEFWWSNMSYFYGLDRKTGTKSLTGQNPVMLLCQICLTYAGTPVTKVCSWNIAGVHEWSRLHTGAARNYSKIFMFSQFLEFVENWCSKLCSMQSQAVEWRDEPGETHNQWIAIIIPQSSASNFRIVAF